MAGVTAGAIVVADLVNEKFKIAISIDNRRMALGAHRVEPFLLMLVHRHRAILLSAEGPQRAQLPGLFWLSNLNGALALLRQPPRV